jgi:hypothetical protein
MKRQYLVDHRLLFCFGFCYYLITPVIVGTTHLFEGYPGMALFREFFNKLSPSALKTYLLITALWLPAFFAGHYTYLFVNPRRPVLQRFAATNVTRATAIIGVALCGVLLLFAWLARNSILGGYASYDVAARGKMSTLLVIFNFFLTYQLVNQQRLSIWLTLGTTFTAIVLLSMGGRMYVFQTLVIVFLYKTSFASRRWSGTQILLALVAGFFVGSIAGLWRMGASFSLSSATYFLGAEPAFTWFSTSSYLSANDVPFFSVPLNFLTSFLNLVPNTFFNLAPYIISTQSMVNNYASPLGADSAWSNFVINFGSVGSCIFLFLCGFVLNHLRYLSSRRRFWATYYLLVCGILPFQFFRDGFYILNKQLFFNFLFLPGLILLVLHIVFYLNRSYRTMSVDTPAVSASD